MSIQEMKSQLHQLIDSVDDEFILEQLLESANQILADQPVDDITDE